MKKKMYYICIFALVLALATMTSGAVTNSHLIALESGFEVRSIDSITQEELANDEALKEIIMQARALTNTKSSYYNTWTGNLYSHEYLEWGGQMITIYIIPYLHLEYGDIPTAGEKTWSAKLQVLKSASVDGITVDDAANYQDYFQLDNIKMRIAWGDNVHPASPSATGNSGGNAGVFDAVMNWALGKVNGPWSTVWDIIQSMVDYSQREPTVSVNHRGIGADFGSNYIWAEDSGYAKLSIILSTDRSGEEKNILSTGAFDCSFDVTWGNTTVASVSTSETYHEVTYRGNFS